MRKQMTRLVAAMLAVVMALALFVPALAAVPMMGEDTAKAEPLAEERLTRAHAHATVQRPALDEEVDAPAGLSAYACTCSGSNPHESGYVMKYPSQGTEHWYAIKKNDIVNFATDDGTAVSNAGKDTAYFSDNKGDNYDAAKGKLSFKISKSDKFGDASINFKYGSDSAKTTIAIHVLDPDGCNHTWVAGAITKNPTCVETGKQTYTCSNCSKSESRDVPATGEHDYTGWKVTKEATCLVTGTKVPACAVCGAEQPGGTPVTVPLADHTYKNGVSGICLVCNKDSATGDVHTHTWAKPAGADADGWVITTAATCLMEGVKTRACSNANCGREETVKLAKLNHSFTGAGGVCVNGCGKREEEMSSSMKLEGGDLESAYIEWPIAAGVSKYTVEVKEFSASTWTKIDDQLVREYPGYMRADALGLKAGTYQMRAIPDGNAANALVSGLLTVKAQDRSGFAFANRSKTPGAYNADGTVKSDANILYITNDKKDEVELDVQVDNKGKTVHLVGLQKIINDGYKKGCEPKPLLVRFIGNIEDLAVMDKGDIVIDLNGKDTSAGITFEGVGNDATINGWGIRLKGARYVEVRNLAFMNCNSDEGDDLGLQQDNEYVWVHNNDFFYGDAGSDADQVKGDGALDTKKSKFITHSYNHFWDCGKCNLQGMKDETAENTITYHHNWFDHSDSRHPRIRTCTVHIYNNYYDGNAKYGVGVTLGASAFVEANYFRNTKYPMLISMQGNDVAGGNTGTFSGENGGVIKAYGNVIVGSKNFTPWDEDNVEFDAYVVSNRTDTVPSTVTAKQGGTSYNNFDQSLFSGYFDVQPESAADAMVTTTAWSGRVQGGDFQWVFNNAVEDSNYAVIDDLKAALVGYTNTYKARGVISVNGTVTQTVTGEPVVCEHVPGSWRVTQAAGCDKTTQQVVNGQETQYCALCGETLKTRTIDGQHSNDGSGFCTNCGYETGNGGGAITNGIALKASAFKFKTVAGASSNEDPMTEEDLAEKLDGYFSLFNANQNSASGVKKRTKDPTSVGKYAEWIDLPKNGKGGITFTVAEDKAPAEVSVIVSSTGTGKNSNNVEKSSTLGLYSGDNTVADNNNKQLITVKGGKDDKTTINYTLPAGTYTVRAAAAGTSVENVRLYEIVVVESGDEEEVVQHQWVWEVTRPATCGKEGLRTGTCSKCGEVTTQGIPATGKHTWGEATTNDDDEEIVICEVCGEEAPADAIPGVKPVTGVTVAPTSAIVEKGKTVTVVATVAPNNATDSTVSWTSGTPAVATVSATGVVTGVSVGTATITVTTNDGNKTATCTVTVVDKTALNAAIAAATTMAGKVPVDTAAANVSVGEYWVLAADKKILTDAITAADAVAKKANATQSEIDAAKAAVTAAADAYPASWKEGSKPLGAPATPGSWTVDDYTDYTEAADGTKSFAVSAETKIGEVTGMELWAGKDTYKYATEKAADLATYDQNVNRIQGQNNPKGTNNKNKSVSATAEVLPDTGAYFIFKAKADGELIIDYLVFDRKDSDTKTAVVVDTTVSGGKHVIGSVLSEIDVRPKDLVQYVVANAQAGHDYYLYIVGGSKVGLAGFTFTPGGSSVDKPELTDAITAAETALAAANISVDGKEYAPATKWHTQADVDTYAAAIRAAKLAAVNATNSTAVTAAKGALDTATAAFTAAGKPGILVTSAPITLDSTDNAVADLSFTVNSMGKVELQGGESVKVPAGTAVYVGYKSAEKFLGVKVISGEAKSVELGTNWSKLELFWLGALEVPQSASSGDITKPVVSSGT